MGASSAVWSLQGLGSPDCLTCRLQNLQQIGTAMASTMPGDAASSRRKHSLEGCAAAVRQLALMTPSREEPWTAGGAAHISHGKQHCKACQI